MNPNVQLSGVLLQPFRVAMKMHCQARLECAVNLLGEKTSACLWRAKRKGKKKKPRNGPTEEQLLLFHLFTESNLFCSVDLNGAMKFLLYLHIDIGLTDSFTLMFISE